MQGPEGANKSRQESQRSFIKFARDVGINVVAKLIAAAAIYLVGVIAGVFPTSPAAIYSAAVFIGLAACIGIAIIAQVMQWREVDIKVFKLVSLTSGIVAGGTGIVLSITSPAGVWVRIGGATLSAFVLAVTAHTFFLVAVHEKRTPKRAGRS
jgi:hypothetical protein